MTHTISMSEKQLDAALDLMRRLPPQKVDAHLNNLIDLAPDLCDDLLQSVDVPLIVKECKGTGRNYLCCDYNRDGDSYRSPYTSEYDPPLQDGGAQPSKKLRLLELRMNDAFRTYKDAYYDLRADSSVYLWESEEQENTFAGVILFKVGV